MDLEQEIQKERWQRTDAGRSQGVQTAGIQHPGKEESAGKEGVMTRHSRFHKDQRPCTLY